MTKDEIMALEGAELDAAVATDVMGWESGSQQTGNPDRPIWRDKIGGFTICLAAAWCPHIDWNDAMRARDAALSRVVRGGERCDRAATRMANCLFEVLDAHRSIQWLKMQPTDICRAALLAVQGDAPCKPTT